MKKQSKSKQSIITIGVLYEGLGKTIEVIKTKNITKKEQVSILEVVIHDLKNK